MSAIIERLEYDGAEECPNTWFLIYATTLCDLDEEQDRVEMLWPVPNEDYWFGAPLWLLFPRTASSTG